MLCLYWCPALFGNCHAGPGAQVLRPLSDATGSLKTDSLVFLTFKRCTLSHAPLQWLSVKRSDEGSISTPSAACGNCYCERDLL